MLKDNRIVVTGGAGFIGSNLAIELSKENDVTIIDDLSTGHLDNIKDLINNKVNFIKGSVTDLALLKKSFKNVDYVFHEAAIPSVPRSVKDPIKSNAANITGTLNVLVAAKDNEVRKVVYASSSSVYGDTPTLPKQEEMTPNPLSPYAVNKVTGELYCEVFNKVYGLSTVSLRYFNVYGPRQDPASEYAAVIPKFITCALKHESPIIFGDGKQTRDFTFISDVVDANILAVKKDAAGVFNIADGIQISINKLAEMILRITEKRVDIVYDTPRLGDIQHSLADISKARKELGYIPKYNLEQGLEETFQWFQRRK